MEADIEILKTQIREYRTKIAKLQLQRNQSSDADEQGKLAVEIDLYRYSIEHQQNCISWWLTKKIDNIM
ncbi:unnamed protein product [Rotaria socialis]